MRHAFAGERGRIKTSFALYHHAVDGDFFAGFHNDNVADFNFFGRDFGFLSVLKYYSLVGADIHKRRNGFPALSDGVILKQFAKLIKKHDRRGFGIFADCKRADRRHAH